MVRKRSGDGSALREPLHWGAFEICQSCLYIALCVLLIAVVALGVLELIGFGSLTQWYGFGQLELAGR